MSCFCDISIHVLILQLVSKNKETLPGCNWLNMEWFSAKHSKNRKKAVFTL